MKKVDYHIHTEYCGHARGSIQEYVKTALQMGLQEICFADHLHRYYLPKKKLNEYWNWTMQEEDLEYYVRDVLAARKQFPQIKILLGIEADYIVGHEKTLEEILNRYPFDHVLASIHCLPQLGWSHLVDYKNNDPLEAFHLFFEAMTNAAKSGLFSSLAHPDFIWRYFPWPATKTEEILRMIEDFVAAVAASKRTCIEANSNSVIWMSNKSPFEKRIFDNFYAIVAKNRVPVTLGSDSHRPLRISMAFGQMLVLLKRAGVNEMALFNRRKRKIEEINIDWA